jgi:hypothetical protein
MFESKAPFRSRIGLALAAPGVATAMAGYSAHAASGGMIVVPAMHAIVRHGKEAAPPLDEIPETG